MKDHKRLLSSLKSLIYIILSLGLGLSFSNAQVHEKATHQSNKELKKVLQDYRFLRVDTSMIGWSKGVMVITDLHKRIIDTVYFSEEKTQIEFEEDFYEESDSIIYDSTRYKEFISNVNYALASIVGNIISVDYSYYFEGGAHPYYGYYTKTYSVNSQTTATLFELFNEADVVQSFKQDSAVRKMIPNLDCSDYSSCIEILSNEFGEREDTSCSDIRSLPESFYIIDYRNGTAKVGFNFSSNGGCHYELNSPPLFLTIKVRKDRQKLFKKAKRNKTLGVHFAKI